ncbi:glycosyltransferase [Motilimonas pumila]|nr:glycosyltransferase [Motilimonas pumila]
MNSKFKLLLFAAGKLDKIGGIQRSYQILLNFLIENGWDITLVGFWEGREYDRNKLSYSLSNKIKIKIINYGFETNDLKEVEKVKNIIREESPSISLIVNSSRVGLSFAQILNEMNESYVYSIRGSSEYCLKYLWPCRKSLEVVFQASNYSHVLMPSYADFFPKDIKEKIRVIPSQIEPAQVMANVADKNSDEDFVILYSGRFSFEKRIDLLISAFSMIKDSNPEWKLLLVGDGPEKESLINLVKDLSLSTHISFLSVNNTEAMYDIYPRVHLKVLPSEQEGCPMALREAMAHSIPVIAFEECSGANEIIEHNKNGLLVGGGDRVSNLAQAIEVLIHSPELRETMGGNALETSREYDPEIINKAWEKLILDGMQAESNYSKEMISSRAEAKHTLRKFSESEKYWNHYLFERDKTVFENHKDDYYLVFGSTFFDHVYYLENYVDVKRSGEDPLLHYISVGWKCGFNPSEEFSTEKYIKYYMDGDAKGLCPLTHYLEVGRFSGARAIFVSSGYYTKWPRRRRTWKQNKKDPYLTVFNKNLKK